MSWHAFVVLGITVCVGLGVSLGVGLGWRRGRCGFGFVHDTITEAVEFNCLVAHLLHRQLPHMYRYAPEQRERLS